MHLVMSIEYYHKHFSKVFNKFEIFTFCDLDIFEEYGTFISRVSFNMDLTAIFLLLDIGYALWQKKHTHTQKWQ